MIPQEIINLVLEANEPRNDGWTTKGCKEKLREIRDFINGALGDKSVEMKLIGDEEILKFMPAGEIYIDQKLCVIKSSARTGTTWTTFSVSVMRTGASSFLVAG